MNRIPNTTADARISGGVQDALLSVDQLVPGVFITATSAEVCWEVIEPPADGIVLLRPHDASSRSANHVCRFDRFSGIQCRCGARRQQVALLMPVANGPRVTVIRPVMANVTLILPDPAAVYGTPDGRILSNIDAKPVITKVVEVWRPPAELVEAMARGL